MKHIIILICFILSSSLYAQKVFQERDFNRVLKSVDGHKGPYSWKMKKAAEVDARPEDVSAASYADNGWMPAIVPGTVLNSLVYNKVYPEPYYGINNKLSSELIPDLYHTGRDFYTYWFRTGFDLKKEDHEGRKTWMQVDGINYRAELWLNGQRGSKNYFEFIFI